MPRIQFSDVTPPEKRSIRNIPIPNSGKRKVPVNKPVREPVPTPSYEQAPVAPRSNFETKMAEVTEKKESGPYEYYYPKEKKAAVSGGPKRSSKTFIFGGLVLIAIAVFVVGMMTVFASATVEVTPKSELVQVQTELPGMLNVAAEGSVRFEVIKLSASKTVSVAATGEEAAEVKASGKIVVYNNFSTEPQRLIVRTRFESAEGLIFRIPESVVVPGKTVKDGVESPGSIEVEVFADEAGEKYNIDKTDFTIPGFKSDATRYKNFYARSSTDMEGGFIGKRKVVDPAVKKSALEGLDAEIEESLKKDLGSKVPAGLVLLDGAVSYKSRELPQQEEAPGVTLVKEVTGYAIMLNAEDLSNLLTNKYAAADPQWSGIKPIVQDFSLLKISGIPESLENTDKITLQLSGQAEVLADLNTEALAQRLLGAPKSDAGKLMSEFPGISGLTATIRPIWKQSFPTDPSKIYIKTAPAPEG